MASQQKVVLGVFISIPTTNDEPILGFVLCRYVRLYRRRTKSCSFSQQLVDQFHLRFLNSAPEYDASQRVGSELQIAVRVIDRCDAALLLVLPTRVLREQDVLHVLIKSDDQLTTGRSSR